MTKSINTEQNLRLSQVGKITTENYVPEDKVEIPYQVIEKPVQEETTNTFTDTTATNTNFDLNQFTTTGTTSQYTETNTQIASNVDTTPAISFNGPYITPADDNNF